MLEAGIFLSWPPWLLVSAWGLGSTHVGEVTLKGNNLRPQELREACFPAQVESPGVESAVTEGLVQSQAKLHGAGRAVFTRTRSCKGGPSLKPKSPEML